MEKLLKRLGIDEYKDSENLLDILNQKQIEYLDRLENITNEERRIQVEKELQEIETTISCLMWMSGTGNISTGIKKESEKDRTQDTINKLKSPIPKKSLDELYDEAIEFMHEKEEEKAILMLCDIAKKGHALAQLHMGKVYLEGKYVTKNEKIAAAWFYQAAVKNITEAQKLLANMYLDGIGVEKSINTAISWYEKSGNKGNVESMVRLGDLYYEGNYVMRNYKKAFEWYSLAEGKGDAKAEYMVAYISENNLCSIKIQPDEILRLYKSAAKKGIMGAQKCLADKFYYGKGVETDFNKAFQLFEVLAGKGDIYAQSKVAEMNKNAIGTRQNYKEAMKWYQEVYSSGIDKNSEEFINAKYNIGIMYYSGLGGVKQNTLIAKQYFEDILRWHSIEAKNGNVLAMCNLGEMYYKGYGVNINYKLSYKWYMEALMQEKEKIAMIPYMLGELFSLGYGIAKDEGKAAEYYMKAAQWGSAKAHRRIAVMYRKGIISGKINNEMYREWIEKAIAKNDGEAMFLQGLSEEERIFGDKVAETFYKRAYEQLVNEDEHGQEILGNMYFTGKYIKQNEEKAKECWKKAINVGSIDAKVQYELVERASEVVAKVKACSEVDSAIEKDKVSFIKDGKVVSGTLDDPEVQERMKAFEPLVRGLAQMVINNKK